LGSIQNAIKTQTAAKIFSTLNWPFKEVSIFITLQAVVISNFVVCPSILRFSALTFAFQASQYL
jgi:hypothetical protein